MLPRTSRLLAALVLAAGVLGLLPVVASAATTGPQALRSMWEVQRGQTVQVTMTGYSPAGKTMTFQIDQRFPMVGSVGSPSAPSCSGNYCTATATYTAPAGSTAYEDVFLFFVTDSSGAQSFTGNYVGVHVTPAGGPVAHGTMIEADDPAPGQEAHVYPQVDGAQGSLVTLSATSPEGQDLSFSIDQPLGSGVSGPLAPASCDGTTCTATFPFYRPVHAGDDSLTFTVTDGSGHSDQARMSVAWAAPAHPTLQVAKSIPFHVGEQVSVPVELGFGGWSPDVGQVSVEKTYTLCLKYDSVGLCAKEKTLPTQTVADAAATGAPLTLEVPDPAQAPETDISYLEFSTAYRLRWVSNALDANQTWPLTFTVVPDATTLQVTPSRTTIHRGDAFTIAAVVTSPSARPVTGGIVVTAGGRRLGLGIVNADDDGTVTIKVPAKATRHLPLGKVGVKNRFSSDEHFGVSTAKFGLRVRG